MNSLGAAVPVDVKRWWCPAHRHLAAPGDMEPRPSRIQMRGLALVEVDPAEALRDAAEAESRRHQHEDRLAGRQAEAEAEASREHERARHEQYIRELPPHLRPLEAA
jgi:hypothetical protein